MEEILEVYHNNRVYLYYYVADALWDICKSDNGNGSLGEPVTPNELLEPLGLSEQALNQNTQETKPTYDGSLFFKIYDNKEDSTENTNGAWKYITFTAIYFKDGVEHSILETREILLDRENIQLFGKVLVALMRDTKTDVINIRNTYVTVDDLEYIVNNELGQVYFY